MTQNTSLTALKAHVPLQGNPEQSARYSSALTIGLIAVGTIVVIGSVFLALKGSPASNFYIAGLTHRINDVTSWLVLSGGVVLGGGCIGVSLYLKRNTQQPTSVTYPKPVPLFQPQEYHLDAVIERVKQAKAKGLQPALLVGRSNGEPQPPKESGREWFTLDMQSDNNFDSSHHLIIDFTDASHMKKIEGLFDKIVVDFSVMKFIHFPWDTLHPLLRKGKSSELTVESNKGAISYNRDITQPRLDRREVTIEIPARYLDEQRQETQKAFEEWKARVGKKTEEEEYNRYLSRLTEKHKSEVRRINNGSDDGLKMAFRDWILEREHLTPPPQYNKELLQTGLHTQCRDYLKQLFNHVELIPKGPLPYAYRGPITICSYWILRDPK